MKIEISEQLSNEPLFPAFYTDTVGDLWLWVNETSGVCISEPTVYKSNEYLDIDFDYCNETWKFKRVQGTITITV